MTEQVPARERAPEVPRLPGLLLALEFLTVLPWRRLVRRAQFNAPPNMGRALPWFPVVGALLGGVLALIDIALAPILALPVRSALLLALGALLTGMLHLDGFVDCCDALLGVRPAERRLDILRDSRIGAYGAIGAALLIVARFAALGALVGPGRTVALLAAPLLGRWAMVYAVSRYPYARTAGAGSRFHPCRRWVVEAHVIAALLLALVVIAFFGAEATSGVLVIGLATAGLAVVAGWSWWASRRLGGGLTGDAYGAANELVELAVLVVTPVLMLVAPHLSIG